MSRFASAFAEGQVAADSAQSARNEIAAVIDQLRADVLAGSGDKIQMAVGESIGEIFGLTVVDVSKLGRPDLNSVWIAKQQWLMACNPFPGGKNWIRLARMDFGEAGYPVSIIYDKVNARCHDRGALEVTLEDLLKSPWCGERLRPLLQTEPNLELSYDNLSDSDNNI